jgi:hypothetical protein
VGVLEIEVTALIKARNVQTGADRGTRRPRQASGCVGIRRAVVLLVAYQFGQATAAFREAP